MKGFLAALRFLTVFPVPGTWGSGEDALRRSTVHFPAVGLIIGGIAAVSALGLGGVLPALPAAVLIVIIMEGASGALHLDGLADTMDGFLSSRPRERVLEIMRDSHNGTMGVAAIASVMLLKVASLGSLDGQNLWRAALLMPLAGRCSLVLSMWALSYARPEGGLASVFYRARPALALPWAGAVLVAAAWLAAGIEGLVAAAAGLLASALFALWCRRKIGGATGDTLGAACEVSETVLAVALAATLHSGAKI